MGTFANSEDPRSALFVKVKKIFRQKNTIFFLIIVMYNGLSQVYSTTPEGRTH